MQSLLSAETLKDFISGSDITWLAALAADPVQQAQLQPLEGLPLRLGNGDVGFTSSRFSRVHVAGSAGVPGRLQLDFVGSSALRAAEECE